MTDERSFERFVADHVAALPGGAPLSPDAYDDIHQDVSRTRQRPEWLALVKEPPMRTSDRVVVGSPTARAVAVMVATMMLAVALAAVGVAGSQLLAANGPIVVAQDGSGDHATISEALASAADGDHIVVMPGEYTEAITVTKSVSIEGSDGTDAAMIVAPADSPLLELSDGREGDGGDPPIEYAVPVGIQLAAPAIAVRGLTISGPSPGVAIAITDGDADLADLAVGLQGPEAEETGDPALDTRLAVAALGSAQVHLRDSELTAAVDVTDAASATVEGNTVVGDGVWSDSSGTFEVRGNVLTEAGISAEGATANIERNHLSNGFISLGGDGHSIVRDNTIDGLRYDVGPGVAISLWDGARAEVTGNTITDSATGIKTLFHFGTVTIDDNELASNSVGISLGGNGSSASGNSVTDSKLIGVEIFNPGPTLTDNTITGNATGLHLGSSQDLTLAGNTICDNDRNVRLVTGEMPDLAGNEVCPDGPAG